MVGLFLIHLDEGNMKIINFPDREAIAKYVKNNPVLGQEDFIIIGGELQHNKDRHIYDGRFQ